MDRNQEMVYIKVKDLEPYENNPRFNDMAVEAVANSIKEFGFLQPVVVNEYNVLLAGHTRTKAAEKLGMEEVPAIIANDLTEAQEKAFRLADNKTAEIAEWDFEALERELRDIEDIDMALFGFEELDRALEEIEEDKDLNEESEEPKTSRVQKGDVWKLGNHRLMCGDSTNSDDLDLLTQGQEMDLCVTDPPYNVDYEGTAGKIENDNMSDAEFSDFAYKTCMQLKRVLKDGGVYYLWHADGKSTPWRNALIDLDIGARQTLIWVKDRATLSRQDYNWKHEPCLYGWKDGAAHYYCQDFTETTILENKPNIKKLNEEELREYARELEDIIADGSSIIRVDKPEKSELHPTMKPVKLMAKSILNSSEQGDKVIDLFGGSGTTMIACQQTDRNAYLMEFDPIYAEAIIQRWEEYTGEEAERLNS